MKFVVLDIGSISPAYFSQPVIQHLRSNGHEVEILHTFDSRKCAAADLVWSEWCNEIAFEAAASGVCKRLVFRMRGYDVWFPLDQLKWENVDALVYESQTLKDLAEERFPFLEGDYDGAVMPAGIDLTKFQWKERKPGNVFALVARATSDKGYQLAMEWARQNPQYQLHVTLAGGEQNPRLVRYLEHTAPSNVFLNGMVDTATWLDAIDANYLLLPTIWETLSYTVAEAMALGIKPLIHDFPGAKTNWPEKLVWRSFKQLAVVLSVGSYNSKEYRTFVETHLDGAEQSKKFTALLLGLIHSSNTRVLAKPQAPTVQQVYGAFQQAFLSGDLQQAEMLATKLALGPIEVACMAAIQLAGMFYEMNDLDKAQGWAMRTMASGGPRADVLCLLGEIAAESDEETARDWYRLACSLPDTRSRTVLPGLEENRHERLQEFQSVITPVLVPGKSPPKYVVVVPVRNAEKWIRRCLESVEVQIGGLVVQCVVVDDASTDNTAREVQAFINKEPIRHNFTFIRNETRLGSLHNIRNGLVSIEASDPEDVCVVLDGDDWFSRNDALFIIEKAYQTGAWMTYGSWRDTSGKLSWMGAYPIHVVKDGQYRRHPWCATQPKTFKRFLFNTVHSVDFKDDAGEWFKIGGDVALMIPMLEMARERAVHIPEVLYTYNLETTSNDHKVAPSDQTKTRDIVFARRPYPRLESRNDSVFMHVTDSEMAAVNRWLRDGATVFDVGCASGEWSSYVCGHFTRLNVHAFDPRPEAGDEIKHDASSTVYLVKKALSDVVSKRVFYRYLRGVEGSSFYPRSYLPNGSLREEISVDTTTIDDYAKEKDIKRIDFLKIDAEGHDVFVLRGAKQTLRNVRVVQFEYGIHYKDAGVTLGDAFDCLVGFRIYRLVDGAQPVPVTDSTDDSGTNYLAVNEGLV